MARGLFLFIGAFVGGVAAASLYDFGENFAFALFLISLGVVFLGIRYSQILKNLRIADEVAGRNALLVFVGVICVSFGLGVLRFDVADLNQGTPVLDTQVGQEVVFQGVVVDEPDVRETHVKLTVRIHQILGIQTSQKPYDISKGFEIQKTKILLITELYPEFKYGDEILVRGELLKPKNFTSDGAVGRTFNYIAWLGKDGIFYQMFYPEIELAAEGRGNPIKGALFSFKRALLKNASRVLPEPHASLLGGITLGAKRALGEELLEDFRTTGIIHIVVLSGYNVTIVAEAIGRGASFLPRFAGVALSVSSIVAFAVMTGAGATIVRASLMALLVLFARMTGRLYEITVALFVAGFLMTLWNPKILIFDPSFQLSFLATVGLIHLAPRLERCFGWLPTKWQIREAATATVATQIFVLPLLLYLMGELSFVAVIVNLLILPVIPLTMFFGFAAAFAGFLHHFIAFPLGAVSFAFLAYELSVVDFFASLPLASVTISAFPAWLMFILYAMFGMALYKMSTRR